MMGKKVDFEDDIVSVYDKNGKMLYYGILDYCPFKDDFDDYGVWNNQLCCYDLPRGYRLVCEEN